MKEYVIYLDPGDDIHSTLDKLSWVKSARVLLVWPDRGFPLSSRYELLRASRFAQQRGNQLGVVSFHGQVRANARELGIPVFSSLEHPEARRERSTLQGAPPPKTFQRRIPKEHLNGLRAARDHNAALHGWEKLPFVRIAAAILAAAALLALLVVLIPTANLRLVPAETVQQSEVELLYEPEPGSLREAGSAATSESGFTIPLATRTLVLPFSEYFLSSGTAFIPDECAEGEVVFQTSSTESVEVRAGTGLRTPAGIRYSTLGQVLVEPGIESVPVKIRALEPGPEGNTEAGATWLIEGDVGLLIAAANPASIQGGSSRGVHAVNSRDRQSAGLQLEERIESTLAENVVENLQEGEILVPGTTLILQIRFFEPVPSVGHPAEGFELTAEAEVRMAVAHSDEIQRQAESLITEELAAGTILVPGSMESELILVDQDLLSAGDETGQRPRSETTWETIEEQTGEEPGFHRVRLIMRYVTAPEVDSIQLRMLLAGKNVDEGLLELEDRLALTKPPELDLFPSWMPVFPFFGNRIQIQYPWEEAP